jgi:metallo-beta-lactamase class B
MRFFLYPIILLLLAVTGCENHQPENIFINEDIQLVHLKDSVFIHVTWHSAEGFGRFSSNGLVIISNGKAILVDTPMDRKTTEILVNFLNEKSIKIEKLIPGHYHDDCIGGMPYLHELGVLSVANILTAEKCLAYGLAIPQMPFIGSFNFDHYDIPIECRYFGGGHTEDNIVVWLPKQKILFGGCLVRSAEASNLGNIADAVVAEWDHTVSKIVDAYPDIELIIPGHGSPGGKELLTHTIELVEKFRINQE